MLIKKAPDIRSSEITPKSVYLRRREFIQASAAALVAAGFPPWPVRPRRRGWPGEDSDVQEEPLSTSEAPSRYEHITSYNNFYEFAPAPVMVRRTTPRTSKPRPWKIKIDGNVNKPGDYDIDDFIKPHALEERVYRMRASRHGRS